MRARVGSSPFAETLGALRAAPEIAYARVARAKWSGFDACYEIFRTIRSSRRDAFAQFVEEGGERLERFALYQTLAEHFARAGTGATNWPAWPAAFHDPQSAVVREFAARTRRRIDFFKYVQWSAHEQLAAAAQEAAALSLGLYFDLAVGADAGGADVWSQRSAYVLEETIGAPPDALGPQGQNWGLPPLDESTILRDGGAEFAALLQANMAYAAALRLDHAMALMRLFRIPRGKQPSDGAYVAYPFEQLLAVVAQESRRARCLVVGEDLGTVPDGFRERLSRERIFSYRLLLFEREADGRFIPPAAYPSLALATATTHDLPTLTGWTLGSDIATRQRLGFMASQAAEQACIRRRSDVSLLIDALQVAGDLPTQEAEQLYRSLHARAPEAAAYRPLVHGAYRYLARSRARLVLVQLDDALGECDQINVPGTYGEYPNWRRKNAPDLAAMTTDANLAALARDVRYRVHERGPA